MSNLKSCTVSTLYPSLLVSVGNGSTGVPVSDRLLVDFNFYMFKGATTDVKKRQLVLWTGRNSKVILVYVSLAVTVFKYLLPLLPT